MYSYNLYEKCRHVLRKKRKIKKNGIVFRELKKTNENRRKREKSVEDQKDTPHTVK